MHLRLPTPRQFLLSLMLLPTVPDRPDATGALTVAGTIALTASPGSGPGTDAAGRAAFIGESRGKNQSTGKAEFMNGAVVTTADTSRLADGSGPHQGTITLSKGDDQVVLAWSGQVTTVLASDKTTRSTFAGTWTALRGSGRYSGVRGQGGYEGRFTTPSATQSVIEWEGTIDR